MIQRSFPVINNLATKRSYLLAECNEYLSLALLERVGRWVLKLRSKGGDAVDCLPVYRCAVKQRRRVRRDHSRGARIFTASRMSMACLVDASRRIRFGM
jgi:hypothetical protein